MKSIKPEILEKDGLEIRVFNSEGESDYDLRYDRDDCNLLPPKESESGVWEMWCADDKRLELRGAGISEIAEPAHVWLIVSASSIGFQAGYQDGKSIMKLAFRKSLDALTGRSDDDGLMSMVLDDWSEDDEGEIRDLRRAGAAAQ